MIQPPTQAQLLEAFPIKRWAWLRVDVRAELERRPAAATVSIDTSALDPDAAKSLQWLLQRTPPLPARMPVKLTQLDRALLERTDWGLPTKPLLEALDGPLDDRAARRKQLRNAADELWASAAQHPRVTASPELQRWVAAEISLGALPAEISKRQPLLADALTVLDALPADGISVTRLAANILGSAHALDKGPLANLVLRALSLQYGQDPIASAYTRTLWRLAGLRPDDLSSRVLLAGFKATGTTSFETVLRAHARCGEPAVITLRQVDNFISEQPAPLLPPETRVWVCENVAVVAEATNALGRDCPPLICVEGWPSHAATLLLQHLLNHGADIAYHGDFDWEGLAIADQVMQMGVHPWRMDRDSYLAAATRATRRSALNRPDFPFYEYSWAPGLVDTMIQQAMRVEEEHVMEDLIADLT
ncbi:TIGR02679 family protein [Micromonospora trifolii]|uniref:TIGR02679 family protein n=1 Tax=Micromonospora trifolii TaxID=2911208 RepID=UPI003CE8BD40